MRDYRFISVRRELLQPIIGETRGIGDIGRIGGRLISVQQIERRLSVRAVDVGVMSKLRIS